MRELGMMGGRGRKNGGKSGAVEAMSEEEAADSGRSKEKKKKLKKKKNKSSKGGLRDDVPRLVMSLSCRGYEEQLAWLEAYLRDEARDRTVDGEWLDQL